MRPARLLGAWAGAVCVLCAAAPARALDLPQVLGKPLHLDVTEVSIVAQRFDSREVDPLNEGGAWGQWINRLQAVLDWNHFTVGVRLDSAVYWNTLADQCSNATSQVPSAMGPIDCSTLISKIARDDLSRYQDSIYLAKLWATYKNKGLEVTLGDSYAQFGRGLVLSMRKLDDLGIDNTIRGVKAAYVKGPFAVTVLGGLANPSHVDEATGQALFMEKTVPNTSPVFSSRGPQPIFGADQIFAAELQAGRDGPVLLTTSMSYLNRCAPNAFTGAITANPGRVYNPNFVDNLIGYCDDTDVETWLSQLPGTGTIRQARHVATVAQSIELPKMGKLGSLYVVAAIQQRDGINDADVSNFDQGSALYATYTGSIKNVTNTIEFKDYRNFYPASGSINATQVSALGLVGYSAAPTIESLTQDNMLGNFNVCVDGLRVRTDVRVNKSWLVYGQGIFTYTKGEQNAVCDRNGNIVSTSGGSTDALTNWVADGLAGIQWDFEQQRSHLYATVGARQDTTGVGDMYLQQFEVTYNFSKYISKRVAIEFLGRHRVRYERTDNLGPDGLAERWVEGENYTGLSISPKWVFSQGIEYSTRDLPSAPQRFAFIDNYPPWLYLSFGGTYKFTRESNIRVFVGQQRGGLKCISGVCRVYPAFEGARAELTLRF